MSSDARKRWYGPIAPALAQGVEYVPRNPENVASSLPLAPQAGLEYTPPVADLLGASLSVGEKGTLTTLSVAPLRAWADAPAALYGLSATLAAESKKEVTYLGGGYVLSAEWIAPGWAARADSLAWQAAVDQVGAIPDSDLPACRAAPASDGCRDARRSLRRRLTERNYDLSPVALLPKLSARYAQGRFSTNTAVPDQESLASRLATLGADWRIGVSFDIRAECHHSAVESANAGRGGGFRSVELAALAPTVQEG